MRRFLLCGLITASLCGPASALTIPEAKLLADNEPVTLEATCVTYGAPDFFYLEEDGRNMGIRVDKAGHGLAVGMRADVSGTMKTNTNGERYVLATSAVQNGEGTIMPVGMNNRTLGGEDWHVSGTRGQQGMTGASGLNNIGLLVRTAGRVMQGAPGDTEPLYIADGGGAHVSVILPAGAASPGFGAYVVVTGVLSCATDHQQVTGPSDPTYQDVQRRVILACDIDVGRPAPEWKHTGQMVYIPAGSFLMGNNGSEPYLFSDELPQHEVYLSGYWIGKHEVTRGEYRKFMEAGGYGNPAYWSTDGWDWKVSNSRAEPDCWAVAQDWLYPYSDGIGGFTQTESHPVVVSYYEAEAYCTWAGGHLPSEAQWEKAARWDGTARVYPWANVWDAENCNNLHDTNPAGGGYQTNQTAPTGSYPSGASPYGLEDMAGNVWEWCRDWYSSGYYSASPSTDPQGPASGSYRALRGGSWGSVDRDVRCANRNGSNPPGSRNYYYGFRVSR